MGADISGFQRGMGTVDNMLHSAGGKLGGFVGMLGTGLAVAGTAAVAGLAAAGAGIVGFTSKAASAQQSVADIAANMQLSADETAKVAKLVNDLGIDPKLKVTAWEAAAAIDMLGKNGQSLTDIFGGTARATILLANSTKADFGTAADIATDVMQQFNIAAADMMKAVNGITGATQNSKFDINDYRLALAQAGGVASSVGVSFEDFNATIAAISPLFAGGSDAGTSFKTFLQRLTPSTKPAIKAMKELGIITADGKNQFFDATGNMKSMSEVAGTLQLAFAGLSDEQKNQYASTIFGTDAMRAAFAMANAGSETINKLKTAIGNTSAEDAAATRMDTLSGDYEIFTGVVDALSIKIGEKFIPAARDMLQWATGMVSGNSDRIVGFFEKLTEYIPSVTKRGMDLFDLISGPGVTKTVKTLAGAFSSLGRTLTLLVRPFREAFGGLFSELSAVNTTGFAGIFDSVLKRIGKAIGDFGKLINEQAVPFVLEKLGQLTTAVYEWAKGVDWGQAFINTVSTLWEWAVDIWNAVSPYLTSFWNLLTSWVTDPVKRHQLWDGITAATSAIWEWAVGIWGKVSPYLSTFWTEMVSWVTDPVKRQQLWDGIKNIASAMWGWAVGIWDTVSPHLSSFWSELTSWVTDPVKRQRLMGALSDAWNWFSTWSGKVWNENIKPPLDNAWRSLSGWVTDPAKKQELWSRVSGTWTGFTTWATTLWDEKIRPALVTMGAKMKIWIDSNYPQLGSWIDAITTFTTDAKNRFVENFPQMSAAVVGLGDTLRTEIPLIGQEIQKLITTLFGSPGGSGGATFMDWITYAVENVTWKIGSLVKQIRIVLDMINLINDGWRRLFSGDFSGYLNLRHEFDSLWNQLQNANQGAPTPPGFASGGRFTRGGMALVGERGPELAEFPPGTRIHKNEDAVSMLGSGGSRRLDIYFHGESALPRDRAALRELAEMLRKEVAMTGARLVYS